MPMGSQLPDAGPDEDFYALPTGIPDGDPGRLIRLQALQTPPGLNGWRILYHSVAVDGRATVVSGLVFAPDQPAAPRSRPVIAWGHGTVGLGDKCAVSRRPEGLIEQPLFERLLAEGFVVTATDYEGLGTPGGHPWLVGLSEGRSMLDSVRAAGQIPDAAAGNRFVPLGVSQGGGAALFAGELVSHYAPELDLLGVVAAAPAAELDLLALVPDPELSGVVAFVVMGAFGFHTAYPELPLEALLTESVVSQRDQIETMCADEIEQHFRDTSLDQVLRAVPGSIEAWSEAIAENTPGRRVTPAPVMLFHGDRDRTVPVEVSRLLFLRLCRTGAEVGKREYAGIDHGGVLSASLEHLIDWVVSRKAGNEPSRDGDLQTC